MPICSKHSINVSCYYYLYHLKTQLCNLSSLLPSVKQTWFKLGRVIEWLPCSSALCLTARGDNKSHLSQALGSLYIQSWLVWQRPLMAWGGSPK